MEPGTFQWTPSADQAFTQIKQDIVIGPALSMFDLQLPTIVTTDSSGYGLGATLTQIKDGQEVLVCCASRKLSDAEKKYFAGEHEALGCLWAIENGILTFGVNLLNCVQTINHWLYYFPLLVQASSQCGFLDGQPN